ncbi:YnbE family lipoprotein [Pasteurella langaaensis]|nr:YnbE family lipoprotein [Pasteurella langaaensis]
MRSKYRVFSPHFLALSLCALTACTPTIQLDTPKEGITINMNVVVDHNISVKMDEKSQAALESSK